MLAFANEGMNKVFVPSILWGEQSHQARLGRSQVTH